MTSTVSLWATFELSFDGPSEGNPFLDVTLGAVFSQGERKVRVSGFYDGGGRYVVRFLPTPSNSVEVNGGLAQVSYVGTGFMMIRRAALARLCDAHPELRADMRDVVGSPAATKAVMVFETMIEPETGHYLSEDYAFCRRWRDLGGEIWADVETRMNHVGHAVYTGSLMQALRPG